MLPGICTLIAKVRPETSTPWMVPRSTCQLTAEAHVPPSGSAPTQQGHRTSHVQTSNRRPSNAYVVPACVVMCVVPFCFSHEKHKLCSNASNNYKVQFAIPHLCAGLCSA